MSSRITQREWLQVSLFTVGLLFITTLPYLLAWRTQGDTWVFNGFLFGVEDGNAYLGKMRLGARGYWSFFLFFTSEPHTSVPLLYWPYLLPGQILGLMVGSDKPALFGWLIIVFHALRLIFNTVLIIVLYRFIAFFLDTPAQRFMALLLACFGGGLGWLLIIIGQSNLLGALPPEFYIPEGFGLLVLLGLPHVALARALLLAGFLILLNARKPHSALWAGLCWLGVGLCVSFYLVIIYALLGAWGLLVWLRHRRFPTQLALRGLLSGGLTLPLFFYYLIVFNQNAAFAQWSSQNLLPSPHPLHYMLAYGILAYLAWLGVQHYIPFNDASALLVTWVLMVPLLVYLPINVQRRLAEGILVPLAILATPALHHLRWRAALMGVLLMSSVLFLFGSSLGALNPSRPLYRPVAEMAALDWLNAHAEENAVLMGTPSTGNLVPARTNLRVFIGHGPETLYALDKEVLIQRFFANQLNEAERLELYKRYHIRYIFYGPLEREFAPDDEQPRWTSALSLIYDHAGYQIYEVLPSCTDATCALGCLCSSLP